MTVLGPVPAADLGITLMHEHILNDCRCWWHEPAEPERQYLAAGKVRPEILGELRMDPFVNRDNITLNDEALAIAELTHFAEAGGRTVVDPTCRGIGRNPEALARISRATGLHIVMGAGYYLHTSHPHGMDDLTAGEIAGQIVREAEDGVEDTGIRIGFIGEIGVSDRFTPNERKSLRGAAKAQALTGLGLMVHLPGWFRLGHDVLDMVEAEGGDPKRTILCHMNPSWRDFEYQSSLAKRGAFIEYDMIGMDYWYADQQVQCPSDEENAFAVKRLIDAGFHDSLLLSHDVFLKMMLTCYGGFGYAYICRHFLPRLEREGVDEAAVARLMADNPKRFFCPAGA